MNKPLQQTLLATLVATGLAASGVASAAKTDLVVVSWGGAYTASQQKAYSEPFMKLHPDVNIVNDDSSAQGTAKLRAQSEAGNVTWDVVDLIASDTISLCDEGLLEEINFDKDMAPAPDGTPASKDFGSMIVSPCFVPLIVYSTTFGYRTDLLKKAPTTIKDVFDLKNFPGKRALQKVPTYNLEWALIADGVDPAKIYDVLDTPEGVDRAFKKLDTIKDQTVWWTQGAQPPQLLADGEVVMASAFNGRLFNAIAVEKQPIAMMWDWEALDLDGFVLPKGAPHRAEALKYIRFASDTQRLADQAKYISYGPARASSAPLVGKHAELGIDMKPHMPTNPINAKNSFITNYSWWADHKDELSARFEAWLAK